MIFTNLTQVGGGAVLGVPRGSKEYVAAAVRASRIEATAATVVLREVRVQAGTVSQASSPNLIRCGLARPKAMSAT
jgi:hypothetical protein